MSLSSGYYVHYEPIKTVDEIYSFITDNKRKVYSNVANLSHTVTTLIEYEQTRKHRGKNYCIKLRIMIPQRLTVAQKHEFIKQYMLSIHYDYKLIPWIYKFVELGEGHYIDILIFERIVYKRPKEQNRVYKRNMFIDPKSGRTCSAKTPGAIQLCKAGEVQRDNNGTIKKEIIKVSPKKYRHLNFQTSKNDESKRKKFLDFKQRLESYIAPALSKTINNALVFYRYKKLKYCFRNYGLHTQRLVQINEYNNLISRLNLTFMNMQDHILFVYHNDSDVLKSLYSIMNYVSTLLENGQVKVNKKYSYNIDPKKLNKKDNYNDNLKYFEKLVAIKIRDWWLSDYNALNIYKILKEDNLFDYTTADPLWWIVH